jgi:hypothetical protein
VAVCRAGVDVGAVVEAKPWQSASLSSSFCIPSDSFGPLLQPLALPMKAFGTVDHYDTPGGRIRCSFCAGELVCSPVIPCKERFPVSKPAWGIPPCCLRASWCKLVQLGLNKRNQVQPGAT